MTGLRLRQLIAVLMATTALQGSLALLYRLGQ
jgi:hypothetical protein